MNNTVAASSMSVKTKTSDNLFIADDTLASQTKKSEASFITSLVQDVTGLLEPVSTVDGVNFFYTATNNVQTSGDAVADEYLNYAVDGLADAKDTTNYNNAFSENYGIAKTDTALAYVEYVFQLKAINSADATKNVNVTTLRLTYGGTSDSDKAFRVAVFVEDITSANPAGTVGTLKSILKDSSANYFTAGKAVNAKSAEAPAVPFGDVSQLGTALTLATVPAKTTAYYKVVVRLWLEGEDTTCNNTTFANLDKNWNLDIKIDLQANNLSGLTALTQTVAVERANLSGQSSIATDPVYVDGNPYYVISGKTIDGKQLYCDELGAIDGSSKIFMIIDGKLYDVTNQCQLTA